MLDPNLLRNELDAVAEKLARRGFTLDVEKIRQQEERRKVLQLKQNPCKQNVIPDRSLLVLLKRVVKILSHFVRKLTN